MKRREFIAGLGGAVATWPLVARAQQAAMPVIGWLNNPVPGTMERYLPAFNQGLVDTGYVVGRNVTIESREGGIDQLPGLAADLVRRQVTVIAAVGIRPAQVAKAAARTIPVVFAMVGDPVEVGVVTSLNHPSGNLTGVAGLGTELAGKRLELLHELVPSASVIAVLVNPANPPIAEATSQNVLVAAQALRLQIQVLRASTASDIDAAFANLVQQGAKALFVANDFFLVTGTINLLHCQHAIEFLRFMRIAIRRCGRLDQLWDTHSRPVPPSRCLCWKDSQRREARRSAGSAADQIRTGHQPQDRQGLGLTVPETLLATADEVIQ
jgi:putative tryptophan/tyrosine transport system substrate-binding protein